MTDPKQCTLEALAIVAESYGVGQDLDALEAAGNWQPGAVAMLAEALAALVIDQRANRPATVKDPQTRIKLARAQAHRVV